MIFEKLREHWHKMLGAVYVIGFVVHSLYLAGFGSYAIDLFQTRYLLTGLSAVAFYATCFAFVAFRTNLSCISDTFTNLDNLFPWLLRVLSLPYIVYTFLYIGSYNDLIEGNHSIPDHILPFFPLAFLVILYSVSGLILGIQKSKILGNCVGRILVAVTSICMAFGTLIFTPRLVLEFASIISATLGFPLVIIIAVWINQRNDQLGRDTSALDRGAGEEDERRFSALIGILSFLGLLLYAIWNYTDNIYPKMPSALGGPKVELIEAHQGNDVGYFYLIQETGDWVLYVADAPCRVEKVRADTIQKIVYLDTTGIAPEKRIEADQRKAALLECL